MRVTVFAALAAAALLASCVFGTDGEVNEYGHDQTTVLGTLSLFVDVWGSCDIETYKGLLDEGTFTFYFDPRDVQEHGLPNSWEYADEIKAVGRLFGAIGAENVYVGLDLDGVAEPEEGAETCTVRDIPYDVVVYDEGADPEPTTYRALGQLDMEFTLTEDGWVIIQWWDKASMRLPGITECTWGALKALF